MVNVASIWHTTLERLETHHVDAMCKAWLQTASLSQVPFADADEFSSAIPEGEETQYFLLTVSNDLARDMLNTRWRPTIENILIDITEQPVALSIVQEAKESTSMHETSG